MQFRTHRYGTEFPTILKSPSGDIKATINDVNETGALVSIAAPLRRGDKIKFSFLNNHVEALVQWSAGGKCGISFMPHLSICQVDLLRFNQTGNRQQRHSSTRFVEMR